MDSKNRLWHAFYSHDNLSARFLGEFTKYHRAFKGLILPEEIADEIECEVKRLREEYSALSAISMLPAKIKKVVARRNKRLDSLPKFKIDSVTKGGFDAKSKARDKQVQHKMPYQSMIDCPHCGKRMAPQTICPFCGEKVNQSTLGKQD